MRWLVTLAALGLLGCSSAETQETTATPGGSGGSGAGGTPVTQSAGGSGGASSTGGSGGEACAFPAGATASPRVHVVYLVPSDRTEVPLYTATLEKTIRELQLWYRDHTDNGDTFEVNDPVVEVLGTPNEAAWYATHATGGDSYLWFWDNVLADAFPLTGGTFSDPQNVWLYYIDADNGCGQIGGGGTSGVAVLPANDLRGLTGQPNRPPCVNDPPDNAPRCRWVGGLGHELGHAFGLPHPPGCDVPDPNTPCDNAALMWTGYASYPDAHLTPDDRAALAQSGFFAPRMLPRCMLDCLAP